MAGPIARFADFGPQLQSRELSVENVATGVRRFIVGLSKKLIFAGALGSVVDTVFALEEGLDIRLAWLGAIGYSLQIYFDFSGYSDMAIGLGKMFGFNTLENFNYPYIASSVGGFWRRWHISLSSWFKDYLYIPLGGNRKGRWIAALNKAIVFTLCGIWHGANWTFLLWGFWHGLLSAVESLQIVPTKKLDASKGGRVIGRIYTLLAVCIGFVMFRATTVGEGFSVIGAMFTGFSLTDASTVLLHSLLNGETVAVLVLGIIFSMPVKNLFEKSSKLKPVFEVLSYVAVLLLFVLSVGKLASGGFAPFIYAQF
jgi:alginate O-acetyltransferase complex protein AlgI